MFEIAADITMIIVFKLTTVLELEKNSRERCK